MAVIIETSYQSELCHLTSSLLVDQRLKMCVTTLPVPLTPTTSLITTPCSSVLHTHTQVYLLLSTYLIRTPIHPTELLFSDLAYWY